MTESVTGQLHQLNSSWDAVEDRILLRIIGQGDMELSIWLTRHFLRMLWPRLVGMAEDFAGAGVAASAPHQRRALAEFQQAKALAEADFSTPLEDKPRQQLLGGQPLLVSSFTCGAMEGKVCPIHFGHHDGTGIELRVDEQILHSLMHILGQSAEAADWSLDIAFPPDAASSPAVTH